MGLNVSRDLVVSVTDEHERFLNTAQAGNCYVSQAGPELVVNVFRRRQDGGDFNDGMPLMYALKGKEGFTVDQISLALLRRRALEKLARHFATVTVDMIVSAPSSTHLPLCIANTLAPTLGDGVQVIAPLGKPTIGRVLAGRTALNDVSGTDRKFYERAVNIMQGLDQRKVLAVKGIHTRARPYFRTVELQAGHNIPQGARILVVDDSCSSGTTLRDSIRVLRDAYQPKFIQGVALIGPARP